MEKRRCPRCSSIYPADTVECPNCGKRNRKLWYMAAGDAAKAEDALPVEKIPVSARLVEKFENRMKPAQVIKTAVKGGAAGVFAGATGIAVVVAMAKQKPRGTSATFIVNYEDGQQALETVDTRSSRYRELMQVLK